MYHFCGFKLIISNKCFKLKNSKLLPFMKYFAHTSKILLLLYKYFFEKTQIISFV